MTAATPEPAAPPAAAPAAAPATSPGPATHESILRCVGCGAQSRVAPTATEPLRCPACGALVPWLVAALVDTFDDEAAVELPVLAAKEHAGRLKVVKLNVDRVTGALPPHELARVLALPPHELARVLALYVAG